MKASLKNLIVTLSVLILLGVCAFSIVINGGANLTFAIADSATGIRYGGESFQLYANSTTETVKFTNREEEYFETVNGVPLYKELASFSNACGAIAGAIVIGFYDKYYEDLIPNYTAYFPTIGLYKPADRTYVPQLIENLYTLMRTNVDDVGVSEDDCINGLSAYCTGKGKTIKYTSVNASKGVDTTAYLNAITNNKPVLLFMGSNDIYTFSYNDTQETISKTNLTGNHIFVGYGYCVVKYYNGTTNFRTDTYLKVACGRNDYSSAYIRVNSTATSSSTGWYHNGYSVSIT